MAKRRLKIYKEPEFVEVQYIDCQTGLLKEWTYLDTLEETHGPIEPSLLTTRGWLIAEDSISYVICYCIIRLEDDPQRERLQVSEAAVIQKGPGTTLTYIDIKGN